MKHPSDFAICISNYLTKHLAGARNLSPNTIKSYRDTFCLLLLFRFYNKCWGQAMSLTP